MRLVSSATCTWGEPVSVSWVRYSLMIFPLTSTVCANANSSLHFFPRDIIAQGPRGGFASMRTLAEDHLGLDDAHPGGADPLDDRADGDEFAPAIDQLDPVPLLAGQLAHQHGLAVADPVLLLGVGGDLAEGEGDLVEGDPGGAQSLVRLHLLLQPGERQRVLHPEA